MSASDYILGLREKVGSTLMLLPGVAGVILNDSGEILLQEKHWEVWSLPAGMIEPGESPRQALVREVKEETGLDVAPTEILGVFGGKDFRYTYPNGHEVEYTVIVMQCDVIGGTHSPTDAETRSLQYFSRQEMPELALPYPKEVLFGGRRGHIE